MRKLRVALLIATLGIAACFEAPTYLGLRCSGTDPCPAGYVCTDSECVAIEVGVDGGTSCTVGDSRACYPGSPNTRNVGQCADGFQECQDGIWSDCQGARLPEASDFCDGRDNDCDRQVDEDCGCTTADARPCYTGPPGTENVALCTGGTQFCVAGQWGSCLGQVLPSLESCNGMDDDCDGVVDNGTNECGGACLLEHPVGEACDAQGPEDLDTCTDDLYACDGLNTTVCVDSGQDDDGDHYSVGAFECEGDCQDMAQNVNPGIVEACNGRDDNCDGIVDEGCGYDSTACAVTPPPTANTTNPAPIPACAANAFFVSPGGDDSNGGRDPTEPFATVNRALSSALPGDCIHLGAGDYFQDIATVRSGTFAAPIRITGPDTAVIRGTGGARAIHVRHDHIFLDGFVVDGQIGDATDPSSFSNLLIEIYSATAGVGVQGVVIRNLLLENALRGCIRIRYLSTDNEIAYNTLRDCDRYYRLTQLEVTEGDGIHVGTYFGSLNFNPTPDPDTSNRNWIHHNVIEQVSQCVDIMDEAVGNIVEFNECMGGHELVSGGYEVRGDWNVFRNNEAHDGLGSGIRVSRNDASPPMCNDFISNRLFNHARTAFWFDAAPQGRVCGNQVGGNALGVSGGQFASIFQPTSSCP